MGKHFFFCEDCGKQISETVCPYCGKDYTIQFEVNAKIDKMQQELERCRPDIFRTLKKEEKEKMI